MREESRALRRDKIAEAAYALLAENGYSGTSMLAIAKRARASNETLYRWYGDKAGLFRSLIEANAAEVTALLETALEQARDPLATLAELGPKLLELLVSERAISLNRAAAADASGALGRALAEAGRGRVAPLIARVVNAAQDAGVLGGDDPGAATRLYVDLLVGDLQIRRAIGAVPPLSKADCRARAALALDRLSLCLPSADVSA